MKKILILPALLIAVSGFNQTFKSSKILTTSGIKKGKHIVTLKENVISFDNVSYNISKTGESKGSIVSKTYSDKEDESRTFVFTYNKKSLFFITFTEIVDGVKSQIICYKPK
jgi:hypothetical protein